MRFPKLLLASLSFAALTACASTSGGSGGSGAASGAYNTLTADQITKADVPTAYEAVDRLRRNWWHDMADQTNTAVVVYMNNQKLDGGADALKQIPAQDVASLEYLKGSDAVMRFGQDAAGGAIVINRK